MSLADAIKRLCAAARSKKLGDALKRLEGQPSDDALLTLLAETKPGVDLLEAVRELQARVDALPPAQRRALRSPPKVLPSPKARRSKRGGGEEAKTSMNTTATEVDLKDLAQEFKDSARTREVGTQQLETLKGLKLNKASTIAFAQDLMGGRFRSQRDAQAAIERWVWSRVTGYEAGQRTLKSVGS